jgi:hypothetical protein
MEFWNRLRLLWSVSLGDKLEMRMIPIVDTPPRVPWINLRAKSKQRLSVNPMIKIKIP